MDQRIRLIALFTIWLGGLVPTSAMAQPVFFDDFNGTSLLPHWRLPPAEDWEYNVSNGMLNVTDLLYPSHPDFPNNIAAMGGSFQPQANFRMDVLIGWEAGPRDQRLNIMVIGSPAGILANFGYRNEGAFGPAPIILASVAGGPAVSMPAPSPGIHQFTITRTARVFEFFLDGDAFARLPVNFDFLAGGIGLEFVGPYPEMMTPYRIDRVQVVPTPGTLVLTIAFVLCGTMRRERLLQS